MSRAKNLDIDLLRAFIAVVDNGSVTRAALQIHRSQSAISMQIKRLEQQLGQVLFERTKRSLLLTQQGKELTVYARRLLNLNDQALIALVQPSDKKILRIGCPDDYSLTILPKLLQLLRARNSGVQLLITTANSGQLRQAMDNNEIDIAILTRQSASNEGVLIYQEHGVWVSSNKQTFLQRPLPLVLFEQSCKYHSQVIDGLEKNNIPYDLICSTSNVALLLSLVREHIGVSVMPKNAVPKELIFEDQSMVAELPVAEVIISVRGGEGLIIGWTLSELARNISALI